MACTPGRTPTSLVVRVAAVHAEVLEVLQVLQVRLQVLQVQEAGNNVITRFSSTTWLPAVQNKQGGHF